MNKLNIILQNKWSTIQVLTCSLIIPSLLLPIIYSTILLLVFCLIICLNLILDTKKSKFPKFFIYPFLGYYISISISFIIDVFKGVGEVDLLLKNIGILIIPLFIFTSNFSKQQIFKILKFTSVIISLSGIVIIVFWVIGYNSYFNQQEFQKKEWFKNQITTIENSISKDYLFELTILPSSKKPNLRKIGSLSNWNKKDSVIRELTVKIKHSKLDVWVFIRDFDEGRSKGAWFNAKTGQIGNVQEGLKAESKALSNGYFKFTLKNKPDKEATREWFYISFVSGDKQYRWGVEKQDDKVEVQLKNPEFYTSSGEDLLKKKPLLNYEITKFSNLENYAHGTYLALIFAFALIIIIINSVVSNWLRYLFVAVNIFVIFALASKAVIISLLILFPVYYFNYLFSYRFIIVVFIIGVFVSFNGYIKERFVDMYQTIVNIDDKEMLGELDDLSTNRRIMIYKDHYNLIKENYTIGYGNANGKKIVASLFSHGYNAHNQFLQSIFNSGILGFILFISFCMSPFFLNKKSSKNKYGLMFFILIIMFNFLFESIMYRQWGLVLVSFIFAIYFQTYKSNLKWFQ